MKELSIEEKAKRYDEALKVANKYKDTHIMFPSIKDEMFPELKESKDERIRKWLICTLKSLNNSPVQIDGAYEMMLPAIAWLEKQGEQKPAIKFKIGDIIKCGLSTLKVANINYNKNFYELKTKEGIVVTCISFAEQDKWELVEQNPAEDRYMEGYLNGVNDISKTLKPAVWSEEDERISSNINLYIRKAGDYPHFGKENIKEAKNWMNALKDRIQPQPKQEWSGEDEKAINDIMWIIEAYRKNGFNETHIQMADSSEIWLKSLKNKVQPQPKQEWSEKDKCMLNNVIDTLKPLSQTTHSGYAINSMIDWLKSLKPQNTWKPSEYELKVLKLAAEKDGACLMGLYEDLKKLREEDV